MVNPRIKVVTIGNGGVGKTTLLIVHLYGKFPSVYTPIVCESAPGDYLVDEQPMTVAFWDTGGGEDYYRLRPLSYPQTDVFLLCFDIGNRVTFESIHEEWIPEVKHHCPDVPIMLMGCKKDLRDSNPSVCVPFEEAERRAEEWQMAAYVETSSLLNVGLVAAFKQCMRIGYRHCLAVQVDARPLNRLRARLRRRTRRRPVPALQEPLPAIENTPSTLAEDWRAALKDPCGADVLFRLESGSEMRAHKIILCAASIFFANIIHSYDAGKWLPDDQLVGISSINERVDQEENKHIVIVLKSHIEDHVLRHCLQFLYTGLPGLCTDEESNIVDMLMSLSQQWELHLLESICMNIQSEEPHLNPSIGDVHITEMGRNLEKDFLHAMKWTDVSFDVEGRHISAHRLVLCTRCQVFSTMLSERFREGLTTNNSIPIPNTTYETFLALLEYLYSDHAPIEEGDPVGILVLADQFCQTRLVTLAEYYITKGIAHAFSGKDPLVADVEVDVVTILYGALDHNAKQLPNWCLHFIARNYTFFKSRREFLRLTEEDRAFVKEHQWPPLSYQRELAQYLAARRKCIVM